MDWSLYTENHAHPRGFYGIDFIAYERCEGWWDLYARETVGSCPELEEGRVDDEHVFLKRLVGPGEIDAAAEAVMAKVGDGYRLEVFIREVGGRREIDKICSHLRSRRISYYVMQADEVCELLIRHKDLSAAAGIASSNV